MKLLLLCLAIFFVLTIQSQEPNGQQPTDKPVDQLKKCLAFKAAFDHLLGGEITEANPVLIEMDKERMTDEYKQRAIEKIKEVYGWDFTQPIEGLELVGVQFNPAYRHILAGAYSDKIKESAFPSSNVEVKTDLWVIKVLNEAGVDIPNMAGKKIMQNQLIGYGEMDYVDEQGQEVFPKIIFWNKLPLAETETGILPLVFELQHDELGDGVYIGGQTIRDVDGKKFLLHRALATFPAVLKEGEGDMKCKDVVFLQRIAANKNGEQNTNENKTDEKKTEEQKTEKK
eukprot:gene6266-10273_t